MPIVVLQLPDVKEKSESRPQKCRYCQGELLQRWGEVQKPVRDNQYQQVRVYRYRCCQCGHTFRCYPTGVDQADQTRRMRKLATLCWVMGVSLRHVCVLLGAFGIQLSHMSVWRDNLEQASLLEKRRQAGRVRVLGLDGAYVQEKGKKRGVVVAVDLGQGIPVAIGYVDEFNTPALRKWLKPIVQQLEVNVIVTDDLTNYRQVAQKLGLEHQICQFHLRRWVNRLLKELEGKLPPEWLGMIPKIRCLLKELPADGSRQLLQLWKQITVPRSAAAGELSPVEQLRLLVIRLSENWELYTLFSWEADVPWTNNVTEQVIGGMKMRYRTVRGYKSREGLLAGMLLSGSGIAF